MLMECLKITRTQGIIVHGNIALMMEAAGISETLVNYHATRRSNAEDSIFKAHMEEIVLILVIRNDQEFLLSLMKVFLQFVILIVFIWHSFCFKHTEFTAINEKMAIRCLKTGLLSWYSPGKAEENHRIPCQNKC
jgi:hypothetical protein